MSSGCLPEGRGDGKGEKARLGGRTAGSKKMAKDLGVDPSVVIGAETARAITENPGQKTIITGAPGFRELMGAAAALGGAAQSSGRKDNEE